MKLLLHFIGNKQTTKIVAFTTKKMIKKMSKKNKYGGLLKFNTLDIEQGKILEVYADEKQLKTAVNELSGLKESLAKVRVGFKAEVVE